MLLLRIMMIFDEKSQCDRLQCYLENEGHYVEAFTDIVMAIHSLEGRYYDVVVSNLQPAGPLVVDLLHLLWARGQSTQVILITDRPPVEAGGVVGYPCSFLKEPFQPDALSEMVRNTVIQNGYQVFRQVRRAS